MARPTKKNQTREEVIIEAVRSGLTYALAAQSAGIADSTLRDWLKRGDEGDPDFAEFSAAVRRAEVEGLQASLKVIKASKDWRAHAWLAERRFPQHYGRQDKLELSGDPDKPLTITTITAVLPAGITDDDPDHAAPGGYE